MVAENTAPGAPVRLKVLGPTAKVPAGKSKVTLHSRLKAQTRWVLGLEYLRPGQAPSFSGLRTAVVR